MISKDLNTLLNNSFMIAKQRNSEFLTTEHVFLSILGSEEGYAILEDLGLDIENTIKDIEAYLDKYDERVLDSDVDYRPLETVQLNRVLNDMLMHVESSGKFHATIGDLLVSLFVADKSFCVSYLKKNGIERLDVVEYVTESDIPEIREDEEKPAKSKKSYLDDFATELVSSSLEGNLDPVIGRESELSQMVRVLCRRKKNNPMVVGESGVGKTALVEGFANLVAEDKVPDILKDTKVYLVEMGGVIAGTKFRGEFEKRLKGILNELSEIDNAILFIDEIHNIIGAGSATGSLDASSILKPVLQSGKIRCIGTTTYSEFKRFFDKEKALSRRFERIDIDEPSTELTIQILEGLKEKYEEFHDVKYATDAIKASVELSKKFIQGRFLPDKAIDLIDDAGAGYRTGERFGKSNKITAKYIENLISKKLKISSLTVETDDKTKLKNLEPALKNRIFGQNTAVEQITTAVKRNKAGLGADEKPIGCFLFTGPSGVGKTALAKELASTLGIKFERFDMSEYMEKHTVSRLIGAPAGYVGYDEGGLLTESIRKNPHMVLLLDEVEKAHTDVLNVLLQIMDSATLTDTSGVKVDFKNVILIMTSNLGSKETKGIGFGQRTDYASDTAVKKFFSPEFRNRLDAIINFNNLDRKIMLQIVDKFISELSVQLDKKKVSIKLSRKAKELLADKGYSDTLGARPLLRVIQSEVKDVITDELLFGDLSSGGIVKIGAREGKLTFKYDKK